jgi:mannitol-1-phosphate 5-dehydrogenase
MTMEKKIIVFGGGKIGRSFIGQLFSRGGYEVVFVDIARDLVNALNERRSYRVAVKSGLGEETMEINNVMGILATDTSAIVRELSGCSIAALSVGQSGLPHVIPLLAKGLLARQRAFSNKPLDIIIAENMRDADVYIRGQLQKMLPTDFPFEKNVGLVETSIGKMVPIMTEKATREDPLQVFAEPYNTLILDAKGFKNTIPDVAGLAPKQNMKAWVDRKLFIHNLGHAAAAYFGNYHLPKAKYMFEVLEDPLVRKLTINAMTESATVLQHSYPQEFTRGDLEQHINDLVHRFQNKALGDSVFRVGCDLPRKLGAEDRLAYPIKWAEKKKLEFDNMLLAYTVSGNFKAKNDEGKKLQQDNTVNREFKTNGLEFIMQKYGRFSKNEHAKIFHRSDFLQSALAI